MEAAAIIIDHHNLTIPVHLPKTKPKRKLVLVKEEKKNDTSITTTKPLESEEIPSDPLEMCEKFLVGSHVPMKSSELTRCLSVYASMDAKKPYQVFLGSPQMSRMSIPESQIEGGGKIIRSSGLGVFVHSQYIINLSASYDDGLDEPATPWHVNLLSQNLKYATSLGCKGVVVHVGKSTKQPYTTAIENMRRNIVSSLSFATAECPLLLETPAGQGTETLKGQDEFIEFVESFGGDPRIKVCLDTCHVFACGHDPQSFVENLISKGLLMLVHFNDSKKPCGSCKDQHAFVGSGYIGTERMGKIAKVCCESRIPMVIE